MCEACKGLGWVMLERPQRCFDGEWRVIGVPQPCIKCDTYLKYQGLQQGVFGLAPVKG